MKLIGLVLIALTFLVTACSSDKKVNELHVATSADYPPFEYSEDGQIRGFDIDLVKRVGQKLRMNIVFDNVQFSTVLATLASGKADMAISTMTITAERAKHFDFSDPYYFEWMAAVYPTDHPITKPTQLKNKKIACLLGSTMEVWLKKNGFDAHLMLLNNSNQVIEALKAGYVDVVIMDGSQGAVFSHRTPGLSYSMIAEAKDGYGMVFPRHSPLTANVNEILHQLAASGELAQLKLKWLGANHE